MAKLTESELRAIVDAETRDASGFVGRVAEQRRKGLHYYLGLPMGNETEGRSKVISTDVADTVDWIMPSLIKIFTASDETVQFEPTRADEEEQAQQATDYINYLFQKKNNGFLTLHHVFKDALIEKVGITKTWWDESEEDTKEDFKGLSDFELQQLLSPTDPNVTIEPLSHEATVETLPDGTQQQVHAITVRKTKKVGRIRIENIPPEEFLISKKAKITSEGIETPFAAHRTRKTASELKKMGYKDVEGLPEGDSTGGEWDMERVTRALSDNEFPMTNESPLDQSMRDIWIVEAYLQVDWDGDGVAEWRKVTMCGNKLLDNEECDGPVFDVFCPVLMPHKFFGRSIADLISDVQDIKTVMMRNLLDGLYLTTMPRQEVVEGQVNLEDALSARVGGLVRVKQPGMIRPLLYGSEALQGAMQGIQYMDEVRENRTGVTKYNQGLDANSLNKTASGITQIMTASQQRIELIARVAAEVFLRPLMRRMLKLVTTHQKRSEVIRLRGKWTEIDPRYWNGEMDVSINVGLGTLNRDQQIQHLQGIMSLQVQAMQGGMSLVGPQEIYHAASKLIEAMGFKNVDAFMKNPQSSPPQQPHQPQPDPTALATEQVKQQGAMQISQQEQQFEMQRLQMQLQSNERIAAMNNAAKTDVATANAAERFALQNHLQQNENVREVARVAMHMADHQHEDQHAVHDAVVSTAHKVMDNLHAANQKAHDRTHQALQGAQQQAFQAQQSAQDRLTQQAQQDQQTNDGQ